MDVYLEDNKYYPPDLSEFHIGFEYEFKHPDEGVWREYILKEINPEREIFDNYNPSCSSCNINKHSTSLEYFRKSIFKYIESLNNYSTQYKMAKKYWSNLNFEQLMRLHNRLKLKEGV